MLFLYLFFGMFNNRNMLIFLYLILSSYVLFVDLEEVTKSGEEIESNNSTTTDLNTTAKIITLPTTTPDEDKELKRQDWDVWCKLQPNSNDCTSGRGIKTTRYYYDTLLEDCKTFYYGRCKSSFNNFATLTECHETCRESGIHPLKKSNYSDKVLCRLQPSFGIGYDYHPMFYFDINEKLCKGFSFSGLGGNANRFPNHQICSSTCLRLMEPELTF